MSVLNTVRATIQKRVAYNRLKYELSAMPVETAIDLGLFREDAAKTAARVIYG